MDSNKNSKSTSKKRNFKVSFTPIKQNGLRASFVLAAENLGKKAVAHHFSMGRAVTVGRNGKVIELSPTINK